MKNPVSAEHAQKFAAYVANWKDVLGLADWRIAVHEKRANRKVMAEVFKFDLEQRSASIRLGKDWGAEEVTDRTLNETALHEILHVFLFELIETAKLDPEPDILSSVEHRVINVLEKLLTEK